MSFILLRAALLVLPVALWFAWWRVWGRRRPRAEERATPWAALAASGLLLVVLSLIGAALFDGGAPGSTYHPTRVDEDGRVVPGRFEDRAP